MIYKEDLTFHKKKKKMLKTNSLVYYLAKKPINIERRTPDETENVP